MELPAGRSAEIQKEGGQKGTLASTKLHHPQGTSGLSSVSGPVCSQVAQDVPEPGLSFDGPTSLCPPTSALSPPAGVLCSHLHLGWAFTRLEDACRQQPRCGAALAALSFGHDPRVTPPDTRTPGCPSAASHYVRARVVTAAAAGADTVAAQHQTQPAGCPGDTTLQSPSHLLMSGPRPLGIGQSRSPAAPPPVNPLASRFPLARPTSPRS